jgi:hypothetical protein
VVEGQFTGARAGVAPPFGLRPATLAGCAGGGWALRVRWRPVDDAAIGFLIAGSRFRELLAAIPTDRQRGNFALTIDTRPASGWRITIDYRWRGSDAKAVLATQPWLPPRELQRHDDRSLSVRLHRWGAGWRCSAGLRSLVSTSDESPGRRSLFASRAELALRHGWSVLCGWTLAWGADVDLIGVTLPLRGQPILRHWGRWREELVCGLERRRSRWRWQIAVSARQPEMPATTAQAAAMVPAGESRRRWEVWMRATFGR